MCEPRPQGEVNTRICFLFVVQSCPHETLKTNKSSHPSAYPEDDSCLCSFLWIQRWFFSSVHQRLHWRVHTQVRGFAWFWRWSFHRSAPSSGSRFDTYTKQTKTTMRSSTQFYKFSLLPRMFASAPCKELKIKASASYSDIKLLWHENLLNFFGPDLTIHFFYSILNPITV